MSIALESASIAFNTNPPDNQTAHAFSISEQKKETVVLGGRTTAIENRVKEIENKYNNIQSKWPDGFTVDEYNKDMSEMTALDAEYSNIMDPEHPIPPEEATWEPVTELPPLEPAPEPSLLDDPQIKENINEILRRIKDKIPA